MNRNIYIEMFCIMGIVILEKLRAKKENYKKKHTHIFVIYISDDFGSKEIFIYWIFDTEKYSNFKDADKLLFDITKLLDIIKSRSIYKSVATKYHKISKFH